MHLTVIVLGVTENAIKMVRRKLVAKKKKIKISVNGDVYQTRGVSFHERGRGIRLDLEGQRQVEVAGTGQRTQDPQRKKGEKGCNLHTRQ